MGENEVKLEISYKTVKKRELFKHRMRQEFSNYAEAKYLFSKL